MVSFGVYLQRGPCRAARPARKGGGREGKLTEHGAGRIITGETGLAHAGAETMSVMFSLMLVSLCVNGCVWIWLEPATPISRSRCLCGQRLGCPSRRNLRKKKKRWGAYPLSMTRAATSSVDEARHVSRCFERGRMDECGWWSSTRGGRYEIGPREGGQTDRQTYPPF
jgi:hypothetical protein